MLTGAADERVIVPKKEILFHGIPVSGGIAIGPVYLSRSVAFSDLVRVEYISIEQVEEEIALFNKAVKDAIADIEQLILEKKDDEESVKVLKAHIMLLQDINLKREVENSIQRDLISAQTAVKRVMDRYIEALNRVSDTYMAERVSDLQDVARRLLRRMNGENTAKRLDFEKPTIVLAKDLTPSDTAALNPEKVLGFATEAGGKNSHTAILARAMGLPAIVGVRSMMNLLNNGDTVILDGYVGMVIIHPEEQTIAYYRDRYSDREGLFKEIREESDKPAVTEGGVPVRLMGNVDTAETVKEIHNNGAEGVGLFRSEYLFMGRQVVPSEESQFEVYRKMAEGMNPLPVTIRTLDIGGDKLDFMLSDLKELNPSLGMRAIRLCLDQEPLFRTQLRAILRASAYGNIKLLIPMISCVGELKKVHRILDEIKGELTKEKIPFDPNMKVGAMLEIPSAILIADKLAKYVDFFSIGTNDLVQYTIAVDRSNEKLTKLYEPLHPAVLSLIRRAVEVSREKGIPISCCGELSSSAKYILVLLGLGLREFSMTPIRIPMVKWVIRHSKVSDAEKLVEQLLEQEDLSVSNDILLEYIENKLPEIHAIVSRK